MKKIKTGLMLYPNTIKICDDYISKTNATSRNDFVEKAIKHYVSYLNISNTSLFLDNEITTILETQINNTEERVNKFLFKLSVELCIIMNLIASYFEIDNGILEKLRDKCVEDVKKSIGNVDLLQLFLDQKGIDDG